MRKEQKFEARLKEMGLYEEWNKQGGFGRVATTINGKGGDIVLFVHEDEADNYSEIHYPSFAELREQYGFVKNCILEWCNYDTEFEKELDAWLADGSQPCPLYPVDVYFPASAFQTYYSDFKDDPDGIMDTTNAHDPALVAQINEKWGKFKEHFRPILLALYERDIDEITDADSFQLARWFPGVSQEHPDVPVDKTIHDAYWEGEGTGDWSRFERLVLKEMKENWEDFAENYLMHIADGQDLDCILKFVRCDVCEGTGRDRVTR